MKMKLRVVQLCIDVSIWNMVAIFELGRIYVMGKIVRIVTGIRREAKRSFGDQKTNAHKKLCTV